MSISAWQLSLFCNSIIHLSAIHLQGPVIVEEESVEAHHVALLQRCAVQHPRVAVNVYDYGARARQQVVWPGCTARVGIRSLGASSTV